MNSTDRLTEELRRQAQRKSQGLADQHPLTLEDVQGRARGIRRTRYAVTGLAAAAVIAVTVPLGIAAGDRLGHSSTGPAGDPTPTQVTPVPSPTPTREPAVPAAVPLRVPLTSDVATEDGPPSFVHLTDGEVRLADGTSVDVADDADTLVPLGSGFVLGGDSGGGERYTAYVTASGDPVWSEASTSGPVVSPTGRLVAFTRPDGRTVTVEEDGTRETLAVSPRPSDGPYGVAAVAGPGTCRELGAGCTVWSNSTTTVAALVITTKNQERGSVPRSGERVDDLPALVRAVSPTGDLALTVSVDGAGGLCSWVETPTGQRPWRTCDWQLGDFSPDGRFLLGYPLEDGEGPRSLALLDARTGKPVVTYAVEGRADVFVRQAVWDADGSVLATVWDGGYWSVLRMAVDGSLRNVPVDGQDGADRDTAPVVLARHP